MIIIKLDITEKKLLIYKTANFTVHLFRPSRGA